MVRHSFKVGDLVRLNDKAMQGRISPSEHRTATIINVFSTDTVRTMPPLSHVKSGYIHMDWIEPAPPPMELAGIEDLFQW